MNFIDYEVSFNKMNELVSVVVPIYNVKDFLEECIISITTQSYRNIEIILVDDGSTDGSSELCNMLLKDDNRIRVIHKKNGGLSDARNVGLKNSNGKYVIFIDSDDVIKSPMIEKLVDKIESKNADVAACGFCTFSDYKEIDNNQNFDNSYICKKGAEVVKALYKGEYQSIAFVAWNKLYKKKLFMDNEIIYPVGRLYEDTFTTYKLLYNSNKVVLLTEPFYMYRIRSGSIMKSSITLKKTKDWFDAEKDAVDYFIKRNEQELMNLAANSFFKAQIRFYSKMDSNTAQECKTYLINEYRKAFKNYSKVIYLPTHKKLIYKLFYKFPKFTSKLYFNHKNSRS